MKIKRLVILSAAIIVLILLSFIKITAKNKSSNWKFFIKEQVGAKSELNVGKNLSFDDQSMYFSDSKDTIYSLDKKTGEINWLSKMQDHSPFQVMIDQDLLYISSFDSHIYCLDKKTGFIVWSFAIPNQYWPDTEVIFDKNDPYVFFADRAGFLYALDKKTGQEIWKKEFLAIDHTKAFVDKTIHFGFIKQDEDKLFINHYPSKKFYVINKMDGSNIDDFSTKDLEAMFSQTFKPKTSFDFGELQLSLEPNVANQPTINCLDKETKPVWSYRIEEKINSNEIYQDGNRLYFFNSDNTILESIEISRNDPNKEPFKDINFTFKEDFSAHFPYKNTNPQVNSKEKENNLLLKTKEFIRSSIFLVSNFKKATNFDISNQEKGNYLEFSINHEQDFYKNVFTDVKVEATFTNQEGDQSIKINGFYYDHNLWKIRAKLKKGVWNWKIIIATPFWINKQSGQIEVSKDPTDQLTIRDDVFITKDNEVFIPVGIQDTFDDSNRDGNLMNNMNYAKNITPLDNPQDYNFLSFGEYLDLYKNEAKTNIFRYGPDNCAPSIWVNLESLQKFEMSINGNLEGDYILDELKARDFKTMMSIFAFYPPYTSKEAFEKRANQKVIEKYLDYVIARYSASIDIWELTNEAAPPLEWQNFISDYLAKNDPYHHPITTNLEETNLKNSELLSFHFYSPIPKNNINLSSMTEYLKNKQSWNKAMIISEFGFKNSNYFDSSPDILRKYTWVSIFRKMGIIFWSTSFLYKNTENANVYLGPVEREEIKSLIDFLPKLTSPLESNVQILEEKNLVYYSLEDKNYKLLYFLKVDQNDNSKTMTPYINFKKQGILQIIDPKTGIVKDSYPVAEGYSTIKLPNFNDDLAIKVTYL